MHSHLEIVMPPTDDVEAAVSQILAPFDESNADNSYPFWDHWTIGGRWSGAKQEFMLGEERINAFLATMNAAGVTVSSVRMGKETLQPASQIAKVDAMWREHFPESPINVCPLFDHYKGDIGDVMKLGDVPKGLLASRVIVAGLNHGRDGLEAFYMVEDEIWNGVSHSKSEWSGKLEDAISAHLKRSEQWDQSYRIRATPGPDWLVVTVDYHS